MYLGKNIKHLRKVKGLSQKDLSSSIGMTHSAISSYEHGNNEPTAGVLQKIARVLEVSVDDLLNKDLTVPQKAEPIADKRLIQYARELEEGRKTAEEALQELSDDDITLMNKLLKRRVRELEQAIKRDNPDLARELDID